MELVQDRPVVAEPNLMTLAEENAGLRADIVTLRNRLERSNREINHLQMTIGEKKRDIRVCEASWAYEKKRAESAEKRLIGYARTRIACAVMAVMIAAQLLIIFALWALR